MATYCRHPYSTACAIPLYQPALCGSILQSKGGPFLPSREAATGDVNGVAAKDGMYAEHQDVTAKQVKAWGVYVESFENGDKIFYNYQSVLPDKAAARNEYQITGGTGKMKGIKGSGTCKLDAGTYACTGEYTIAAPAAAKS